MTRWDHRLFGTPACPAHQSDLSGMSGSFACGRRFFFEQDRRARGDEYDGDIPLYFVLGTAVHAANEMYLKGAPEKILAGTLPTEETLIGRVLPTQFEAAREGRTIQWRGADPGATRELAARMVRAALEGVAHRATGVEFAEASFHVVLGEVHCVGTVDVCYRHRDGGLGLADWKTGSKKPTRIALDMGRQLGIYAHALRHGVFFPGIKDREVEAALRGGDDTPRWHAFVANNGVRVGEYPAHLHIVHLRDCEPYTRASSKTIKTPEEARLYGTPVGSKHKCAKGDPKGPCWYGSKRTDADMPRLLHGVHEIVRAVRLGVALENLDSCERCAFRDPCFAEGFEPRGISALELNAALAGVDLDGFFDEAAAES